MVWFFILIFGILAFAFLIDWRRKKNNNTPHIPTDPNANPEDRSNYTMGVNNRDSGGGGL